MRALCLMALASSLAFGQVSQPQTDKKKASDFEASVVKIIVFGIGPAGYTSIGTGFFVSDHQIASAAHVYLEAARAIVDNGVGIIGAYKVTRAGTKVFFPAEYRTAD